MYNKFKSVLGIGLLAVMISAIGLGVFQLKVKINDVQENQQDKEEEKVAEAEGPTEVESNGVTIVLDPGHGGYDPGKVGINGAMEKDINLEIASVLSDKLQEEGYEVVMTRTTDTNMQENGSDLGKVKDLDARVEKINDSNAKIGISIHQNSYTTEDVKGAQVFYYEHSLEGETMAQIMQEALCELDTSNHRQKKANTSYYLLKRTTVPTIIVECGFLSNMEEATKLGSKGYQEEMADAIIRGIEKYLQSL